MIHFTCDMCGKALEAEDDTRYVVKVEVYAAYDPLDVTGHDLADDRSEEIRELLDQMADMEAEELEDGVCKVFRFDLCPECHAAYLRDPLSRTVRARARFGHN